ncbi:asialoglycoprotein receptor 2-like isoform X2 [Nelusetta ayraudi]|uniref:asialoglycoprotein receptor 2-like isoform X2 n=1 Tax=Nelusetta ayraudi TaxID=303726 RepID=UPI003F6ECDF8
MSEDVYAKPEFTRKVRFQASDEDKKVDGEQDISNVIIYDNYLPGGGSMSTSQENLTEEQQTTTPVSKSFGKTALKVAVVLLALLLLLSLAAVIILATLYGNKRDERETFSSQLKSFSDNLTAKTGLWDELKESYSELRGTIYNLSQKMSQLEKDEDILTAMTDNLTSEVVKMTDELQAKEARQCPASWTKFGRSCYFIPTSEKSWHESNETCQRNQAHLVIVSSRLEQLFLISLGERIWIGLTDVGTKQPVWKWVDGSPLTTKYWALNQPDITAEKCVEIMIPNTLESWNDFFCNRPKRFVCEKTIV